MNQKEFNFFATVNENIKPDSALGQRFFINSYKLQKHFNMLCG
jgi:hypothetical protein